MHQQTTAHNKTCINTLFAFTSCSSVASSNSYSSTIAIVTLNLILWWIDVKDTKKKHFPVHTCQRCRSENWKEKLI